MSVFPKELLSYCNQKIIRTGKFLWQQAWLIGAKNTMKRCTFSVMKKHTILKARLKDDWTIVLHTEDSVNTCGKLVFPIQVMGRESMTSVIQTKIISKPLW